MMSAKEFFMVRRFFANCIAAGVAVAAGKMLSDYAETRPPLKNVKDALKKTGADLKADCIEVFEAARRAFAGENTVSADSVQVVLG